MGRVKRDEVFGAAVAVLAAVLRGDQDAAVAVLARQDPMPVLGKLADLCVEFGSSAFGGPDRLAEVLESWLPGQRIHPGGWGVPDADQAAVLVEATGVFAAAGPTDDVDPYVAVAMDAALGHRVPECDGRRRRERARDVVSQVLRLRLARQNDRLSRWVAFGGDD